MKIGGRCSQHVPATFTFQFSFTVEAERELSKPPTYSYSTTIMHPSQMAFLKVIDNTPLVVCIVACEQELVSLSQDPLKCKAQCHRSSCHVVAKTAMV